jgi:23S rRNA-/tRNA-specific pseudouridylate synthase
MSENKTEPTEETETGEIKEKEQIEEYYFESGKRFVIPYYHDFQTSVKQRWKKMKVIDMYLKEFPYYTREYLEKAIELGRITIDGKKIDKEAILIQNAKLNHTTHRHELPVFKSFELIKGFGF